MKPLAIDALVRDHPDGDALGTGDDGAEERGAMRAVELLRVVQERERADAVVAQPVVVEEDACDDEGSRQGPSSRLVGAGDESRAEPAIEAKKPLAGPSARPALRLRLLVRLQPREPLRQALRARALPRRPARRPPRALPRPALRHRPSLASPSAESPSRAPSSPLSRASSRA